MAEASVAPRASRGARVVWWIIGSLSGLGLLLAMFLLIGWALGGRTETQTAVFTGRATRVELNLRSGDVTIRTGADDAVTVQRTLSWVAREPGYQESWRDGVFTADGGCDGQADLPLCEISYVVWVPRTVEVVARTTDGRLIVEDVSGPVDARSGAGSVELRALRSQDIQVSTGSGDISARLAVPPARLNARAEEGSVYIGLPRSGGYQIRADTDTGLRDIGVSGSADGASVITAVVRAGDVSIQYE